MQIVKSWVKLLTRQRGYTDQMVEDANAVIFTFGSYRLGVSLLVLPLSLYVIVLAYCEKLLCMEKLLFSLNKYDSIPRKRNLLYFWCMLVSMSQQCVIPKSAEFCSLVITVVCNNNHVLDTINK